MRFLCYSKVSYFSNIQLSVLNREPPPKKGRLVTVLYPFLRWRSISEDACLDLFFRSAHRVPQLVSNLDDRPALRRLEDSDAVVAVAANHVFHLSAVDMFAIVPEDPIEHVLIRIVLPRTFEMFDVNPVLSPIDDKVETIRSRLLELVFELLYLDDISRPVVAENCPQPREILVHPLSRVAITKQHISLRFLRHSASLSPFRTLKHRHKSRYLWNTTKVIIRQVLALLWLQHPSTQGLSLLSLFEAHETRRF